MTRETPVVVVGAGLAGLTCAYRLSQAGIAAEVFEARERLGGRCWSAREVSDGQIAEHGGEFIDPDHFQLLGLIDELGLEVEERGAAGRAEVPTDGLYVIGGHPVARDAVEADVPAFIAALAADLARAGESWTYDRAGPEARQLDTLSVQQWLEAKLPDASAPLGSLLRTLVLNMFGVASGRLSSLVLLELFAPLVEERDQSLFGWIGRTMESASHVRGGNDLVVSGMAERLGAGSIHTQTPLEMVRRTDAGRVAMRFGGLDEEVVADRAVLTLPFATLREIEFGGAGFSDEKVASIRELGMGTNTKLLLGLDRRVAAHASWRGFAAKDGPDMFVWDSSVGQPEPPAY